MKFPIELVDRTIMCSEMTVKQYKEFLKSIYGDEPDYDSFALMFASMLSELTDLSKDEILDLSIIDIFLIVLEIRMYALGNRCSVSIQLEDESKANLDLSLALIVDDLKAVEFKRFQTSIEQKNITVHLSPPSFRRFKEEAPEGEEHLMFIDSVEIHSINDSRKITTHETAKMVSDNLSPKHNVMISKRFVEYLTAMSEVDLLVHYKIKNRTLKFTPTFKTLMWYIKLFFSEPLNTLYDNLFYLSYRAHIDPSYIEQCTPGEYIYFIKKLEQVLHDQRQANDGDTGNTNLPSEDDNMQDEY